MKVVAALTGVTLVLLSAVVIFTVRSDSGTSHATTVVSQSSGDASAPAGKSPEPAATATAPGVAASPTQPPPSAQDVQRIIAGIMAPLAAPTSDGAAPTKEQIEAQVRAQLQQLGINY
jgi:hypothetical protein